MACGGSVSLGISEILLLAELEADVTAFMGETYLSLSSLWELFLAIDESIIKLNSPVPEGFLEVVGTPLDDDGLMIGLLIAFCVIFNGLTGDSSSSTSFKKDAGFLGFINPFFIFIPEVEGKVGVIGVVAVGEEYSNTCRLPSLEVVLSPFESDFIFAESIRLHMAKPTSETAACTVIFGINTAP